MRPLQDMRKFNVMCLARVTKQSVVTGKSLATYGVTKCSATASCVEVLHVAGL